MYGGCMYEVFEHNTLQVRTRTRVCTAVRTSKKKLKLKFGILVLGNRIFQYLIQSL